MSNTRPEPFQNGLGGSAEGQRNPYQTTDTLARIVAQTRDHLIETREALSEVGGWVIDLTKRVSELERRLEGLTRE